MGHFAMSKILLHGFLGLILCPLFACNDSPVEDAPDERTADMAPTDGGPSDSVVDALDGQIPDAEPDETDGGEGRECGEGEPVPDCSDAVFSDCVPSEGINGATLIRGTLVTPDRVICDGEVLFSREEQRILCVGDSCSDNPLAADASVICSDFPQSNAVLGFRLYVVTNCPKRFSKSRSSSDTHFLIFTPLGINVVNTVPPPIVCMGE